MNRLLYFSIFLFLFSCEAPNIFNPTPYYKFDKTADKWLTKLYPRDTLKFIGSDGSKLTLFIQSRQYQKYTEEDCGSLFGYSCTTYYHYDDLYIVYKRIEEKTDRYDNLRMTMRIDTSISKKNIPKGTVAKAKIQGQFYGFNSPYDFPYLTFPDLYSIPKFETFTNNLRTYNNVIILNSGRNDIIIDRWFRYERNFSEIGFDMEYGFVYFKDIKGKIWKRIN